MSLWAASPARQDVIEEFGEDWTDPAHTVVNGPFTLTGLVPGAGGQAILEPNPEWALEPEPTLSKITIKFIDDLEAAFQDFQDGELDMTNVPVSKIPTIQADPTLSKEFLKVGASRIWAVEMQMSNPTIADFNVRLALSRAIDRNTLVNVVYGDAYLPATYWLVQGLPGFQGNAAFENIIGYNSGAAQTALADAGYPNGQGFPTLKLTVLDRPDRMAEAEFLQNSWNDVLGINVVIEAVDAQTRSQIFTSETFELFPGGWQNDYPDPENSLIGLFDTGGSNNHYNCSDPDIDAKLSAAATETDNATRIQLLQEAETLIVTRLCGVAPVYETASLYLVKSKIGGVTPNGQIDAAMPGNWCPECWFVEAEDQDGDGFSDARETYLGTDPLDACRDDPSDAAWPLDVNNDGFITVAGDVFYFRGRIGETGGPPPSPNWWVRLDLNMDNFITVAGDVFIYRGMIGETCT